MFVLKQHFKIGTHTFTRSNQVEIRKSANLITDTAVIKLPISAVVKNEESTTATETAQLIQVGDKVEITLGYDQGYLDKPQEHLEFTGVVTKVHPGIPLKVECEDDTWHLKQKEVNKSWEKTTFSSV